MTVRSLSERAVQQVADFLVDNWDASQTRGFDPSATDPSSEAFCPLTTRNTTEIGEVYPNITCTFSTENGGGASGYDFLSRNGPGQNRAGQVIVTVRVLDEGSYTGDSSTYSAVDAETLVETLVQEIERIPFDNPQAPGTDFYVIASNRGANAPDDTQATPAVRIDDCEINYSYLRAP